jgi:hypothetical protein
VSVSLRATDLKAVMTGISALLPAQELSVSPHWANNANAPIQMKKVANLQSNTQGSINSATEQQIIARHMQTPAM